MTGRKPRLFPLPMQGWTAHTHTHRLTAAEPPHLTPHRRQKEQVVLRTNSVSLLWEGSWARLPSQPTPLGKDPGHRSPGRGSPQIPSCCPQESRHRMKESATSQDPGSHVEAGVGQGPFGEAELDQARLLWLFSRLFPILRSKMSFQKKGSVPETKPKHLKKITAWKCTLWVFPTLMKKRQLLIFHFGPLKKKNTIKPKRPAS